MNFILGGGITGSLLSYYFEDFTVLTKSKGQDSTRISSKIIERNQYTDKLIKKLNKEMSKTSQKFIPIQPVKIKYAYSLKGKLKNNFTEEEKTKCINKIYGIKSDHSLTKTLFFEENCFMDGYYVDELYNILTERWNYKSRRMFIDINKIDSKKHTIEGINPAAKNIKFSFNYEYILNTLPVQCFNKYVVGDQIERNYNSQIIIYIIKSRELYEKLGENEFIYFLDDDLPYYKMSKIGENLVSIETNKIFFTKNFLQEKHGILNILKFPNGRIVDETIQPKQRMNILHIGCYANNNNMIKIHNIIESLEKGEINF